MPVNEEPVMKAQTVSYKRSLIIGMLIGDAYSRRRTKADGKLSAEFSVRHSQEQKDLAEWKAEKISRHFGISVKVRDAKYGDFSCSRFSIIQRKRLRVIHDWFHKNNRKVISEKIRFMDHPIGLAMLLCDDGSVRRRKKKHKDGSIYYLAPSITIATHGFSDLEVKLLLQHIGQMSGAQGYINPERRVRREEKVVYYRADFNADNSKILWDCVSAWIPRVPSMMKKFQFIIERYGLNEAADT
jgi:LAGLIDADG DNA endonuclease family